MYVYDDNENKPSIVASKVNQQEDDAMSDDEAARVVQVGKNDAYWVQNLLQSFIKNQSKAKEFYSVLNIEKPDECEAKIKNLVKYYDTLRNVSTQEIDESEMYAKVQSAKDELSQIIECKQIADAIEGDPDRLSKVFSKLLRKIQNKPDIDFIDADDIDVATEREVSIDFKQGGHISEDKVQRHTKNMLDLDNLRFESGGHYMANSR